MRRARSGSTSAAASSGELNIVPFLDIVVNVVMYLLAVVAFVLTTVQLDSDARPLGPGRSASLGLFVTVGRTGIHVATSAGTLGPGCRAAAVEPARPAVGAGDWSGLDRCARLLKAANPGEDALVLGADPDVPYEQVVAAMDALRPSFPDVQIAVAAR